MSTTPTEAHQRLVRLIRDIYPSPHLTITDAAQLIAESEARACDQLRAELDAAKEKLRTEAVDDYSSIKELQRELRTEREKLDWIFQNCKVEANDYTTGNRDVYAIHDREDLGAAMKEDAK